jgi:hypothetical protein
VFACTVYLREDYCTSTTLFYSNKNIVFPRKPPLTIKELRYCPHTKGPPRRETVCIDRCTLSIYCLLISNALKRCGRLAGTPIKDAPYISTTYLKHIKALFLSKAYSKTAPNGSGNCATPERDGLAPGHLRQALSLCFLCYKAREPSIVHLPNPT